MELDSESEDEPTGLRNDHLHPVSDSDEDESDGEGLAEFRKALRDAEPRKYRIVNPEVNPVPANADEFDVVDDFNQVEAGDAILSTFPGARATREDGGQTKVLVGPDELHRKFVLFLGEYARIPDPDYEVTAEDRALFSLYMRLAHLITPCSRHSHARKRTKGMGDHIGESNWCCIGHVRAAQYETLVEILGAEAADQLRAATPSVTERIAIITRAEATLMACQPKRLASFVVAGHSAFVGPVLLANTEGLVLKRVVSGDDDSEPLTLGIVPENWVESGLPALPPPPPGFAYAHADEACPYVAPEFLKRPPRDLYLPYDRATVGLAAAPTTPSPAPSPMTTTAVVCWDPLGPTQGPYHSPFWDDSCENTGLSVATGACCIAPARAVDCNARLIVNGVGSLYGPLFCGVPDGVLRRLFAERRLACLGSVDEGFDCDFVVYLGAHTRSLLVAGISSRLPPGGDVALKFRAKNLDSAEPRSVRFLGMRWGRGCN